MKILVTGKGSYIGEFFKEYMLKNYSDYAIDALDMLDNSWKESDFSGYDVVLHVAGIAHIKETSENASLYYKVNCDLASEVCRKAKNEGVGQFVFLSTMSVYGKEYGVINANTKPQPLTNYGKSKLMAEERITALESENFRIAVLRPPMVYGKGCKGNFQALKKIAQISPVFPRLNNSRSMIYIVNLCEFIKLIADNKKSGVFFPQNDMYSKTEDIVRIIAEKNGKKIYFSVVLGILVKMIMPFSTKAKKAFGSLIYDIKDEWDFSYCKENYESSFKKSI